MYALAEQEMTNGLWQKWQKRQTVNKY